MLIVQLAYCPVKARPINRVRCKIGQELISYPDLSIARTAKINITRLGYAACILDALVRQIT
jgi:hypothetical protein